MKTKRKSVTKTNESNRLGRPFHLAAGAISCTGSRVQILAGVIPNPDGTTELRRLDMHARSDADATRIVELLRAEESMPAFNRDAILRWVHQRLPEFQELLVPVDVASFDAEMASTAACRVN